MASIAITDFWELTVHINFNKGGFTEKYRLADATVADAKSKAVKLISCRADLFSKGMVVAQASLSKYTKFKDFHYPYSYRYRSINLAGEADLDAIATANDFEVGPLWRFDTNMGRFGNRVIRGLRDSQIVANDAVYASSALHTQAQVDAWAGAVANTTTHAAVMQMYLSAVVHLTKHIVVTSKTAYVNGVRTMTGVQKDWVDIQYRKLGSRDYGARYGDTSGRQSAWA